MPRCLHCQREISDTVHRTAGYRVDGYCLHTGKTKRVVAQTEDGRPHAYLQLFEPVNAHLCADCLLLSGMKDVWLQSFPDSDALDRLRV
jgi:hypothetical protein